MARKYIKKIVNKGWFTTERSSGNNNYAKKLENRKKISKAKKGIKQSKEHIDKRKLSLIGKKHTEERKEKNKISHLGKKRPLFSGNNHFKWIKDRTQLKKNNTPDRRLDSAMIEWRKNVYSRDNYKCKITNIDCKGRLEAHHILDWVNYPELRYEINNGITLCHAHHPRGRKNEAKLSPYFQKLVTEMK